MDGFAILLVGLAMVVGIVGTLLPFLPGLPVVWVAALVYGAVEGFGVVGWTAFAAITAIGIAGLVAGTVLPHRRVAAAGVPRSTVWFGLLTGVVGFFVIPVVGLPIGAAVGVMVAEQRRLGEWPAARRATWALLKGFGLGALVQVGAGVAMMLVWVAWVLIDRV